MPQRDVRGDALARRAIIAHAIACACVAFCLTGDSSFSGRRGPPGSPRYNGRRPERTRSRSPQGGADALLRLPHKGAPDSERDGAFHRTLTAQNELHAHPLTVNDFI